jgi:hypothetical protein
MSTQTPGDTAEVLWLKYRLALLGAIIEIVKEMLVLLKSAPPPPPGETKGSVSLPAGELAETTGGPIA